MLDELQRSVSSNQLHQEVTFTKTTTTSSSSGSASGGRKTERTEETSIDESAGVTPSSLRKAAATTISELGALASASTAKRSHSLSSTDRRHPQITPSSTARQYERTSSQVKKKLSSNPSSFRADDSNANLMDQQDRSESERGPFSSAISGTSKPATMSSSTYREFHQHHSSSAGMHSDDDDGAFRSVSEVYNNLI